MDLFDIIGRIFNSESVALITIALVIVFGAYVINKVVPMLERMFSRFIDDVAKPMIPLAQGAVNVLEAQGKAMALQNRCNEQMVETIQDSIGTTRELFDMRIAQTTKEWNEQVKDLRGQMKKLGEENTVLKEENAKLKAELKKVKAENIRLKEELEKVKNELEKREVKNGKAA